MSAFNDRTIYYGSAFGQRETDGVAFGVNTYRYYNNYQNGYVDYDVDRYHDKCKKCQTRISRYRINKDVKKAYNVTCLSVVIHPTDPNKNAERYYDLTFCIDCMRTFPIDESTMIPGSQYRPKSGTVLELAGRNVHYETLFIDKGEHFEILGG